MKSVDRRKLMRITSAPGERGYVSAPRIHSIVRRLLGALTQPRSPALVIFYFGIVFRAPAADLIPADNKLEKVAGDCKFTEGPAADAEGNLFFTDSPNRRIMVVRPGGKVEVWNDEKTLYVADNAPGQKGAHTLVAYDIAADGACKRRAVLHDFGTHRGIDGMVLDTQGNIYATAESGEKTGVYIFSPEGKELGFIHTPETATNCTFGDKDLKTLYVTAGRSLYKIRLNATGFLIYPPAEGAK